MSLKSELTIKTELLLIQMITCAIALVVAGGMFGYISYKSNRSCALHYLECQAALLARNALPALEDNMPQDADKILETLQEQETVLSAYIYDTNGAVFASYICEGETHAHYVAPYPVKKHEFYKNHIHIFYPVMKDKEFMGSVCIEDNLSRVSCTIKQNISALITVFGGTFLIALLFAMKLRASISNQILALTRTAMRISVSSDYSVRMPLDGNKEIQILSRSLNEMLIVIQNKIREMNDCISELCESNKSIKHNRDQLESLVNMRTNEVKRAGEDLYLEVHEHELSERMLRHTLTKLETTNKELERFASVSAHDLQEPLRKIKTFGDRILSAEYDAADSNTKKYVTLMLKSALQMQFMINDLLAFSTLGRRKTIFRTVDMNMVMDWVMEDLKSEISDSQADITVKPLPQIDAERHLIQQMFRHLVANAIKFRREGTPLLIEIYEKESCDETVTIAVKDNGIGFNQKYATRIFEIFQRLHGRHAYSGTGVGLAICKRIADVHGGRIAVESELGSGTVFYITLPREHKYERES